MSEFTDDVTASEETVEATENQEQQTTQQEDYLSMYVGEDKEYKTVEDAAKALAKKAKHADAFIETLKSEKQELEQKYNETMTKNRSIDEILEALQKDEPVVQQQPVPDQEPTKQISVDDVLAQLEERNALKAKQENRRKAIEETWSKLDGEFGSREAAKAVVAKYISNDETKKSLIDSLAIADPNGLITILKPMSQSVTFSENYEGRPQQLEGAPVGKLTWDDVKRIRKDNPKLYNSRAFKQRMHTELN